MDQGDRCPCQIWLISFQWFGLQTKQTNKQTDRQTPPFYIRYIRRFSHLAGTWYFDPASKNSSPRTDGAARPWYSSLNVKHFFCFPVFPCGEANRS